MIHPHEITIGSLLRTNEGEIIRVETITSKAKHRKVGYHPQGRPTYMRYARLAQCEGVELTPEILEMVGFSCSDADGIVAQKLKSSKRYTLKIDDSEIVIISNLLEIKSPNRILPILPLRHIFFVQYLHQLQFALICAGLHDLANNIKI